MLVINIPGRGTMNLKHLVLDYNGTIAADGVLLESVSSILPKLAELMRIHVVTADTFGSVAEEMESYPVSLKILSSDKHTQEKKMLIESLGSMETVAIGNGANDRMMIKEARLGIAVTGSEGCSSAVIASSDILCFSIKDALELLLFPERLKATLRE